MIHEDLEKIIERLNGAMGEKEATRWRYEVIIRLVAEVKKLREEVAELPRLRLIAHDAKNYLDSRDAGSLAALAESVAAWERGEDVDEEDLGK